MREIDSRGSKRRRVRQVRRRQPYDALARRGQASERWQQQSKLADALAATQDLGELARGPSAAGKLRIQIGETRRHDGRGPPRRRAAPNPGLLQEIFQDRHDTGILYSIGTIASENRGQSPISVNPTSRVERADMPRTWDCLRTLSHRRYSARFVKRRMAAIRSVAS